MKLRRGEMSKKGKSHEITPDSFRKWICHDKELGEQLEEDLQRIWPLLRDVKDLRFGLFLRYMSLNFAMHALADALKHCGLTEEQLEMMDEYLYNIDTANCYS